MALKDLQQNIVTTVTQWQKVENASLVSTSETIAKTDNRAIRLIMEIIQRDSQMHYRIQQWIADSLQREEVSLSPDDLNQVWDIIEKHIEIEKKMAESAKKALMALKGAQMAVQEYFLTYLMEDERKHETLLTNLEKFKKGMYP